MSSASPARVRAFIDRYRLDADDVVPMAHLLTHTAHERVLPVGTVLCDERDIADGIYLLVDGALRVQKRDARNTYRDLAVARAPALLGHMGMVTGRQRTAALVAGEGGAVVLHLGTGEYRALMAANDAEGDLLRRLLLGAMLDQLHRATVDVKRRLGESEAELPAGWAST